MKTILIAGGPETTNETVLANADFIARTQNSKICYLDPSKRTNLAAKYCDIAPTKGNPFCSMEEFQKCEAEVLLNGKQVKAESPCRHKCSYLDNLDINFVEQERPHLVVIHRKDSATMPYGSCTILNQTQTPVLITPGDSAITRLKNIAYVTDLRYCDIGVLSKIIAFAKPFAANIYIFHVTAEGLPDIDNLYSESLFKSEILPHTKYKSIDLINIKGEDILTEISLAADILEPDLMVMVNKKHRCIDRLYESIDFGNTSYGNIPLLIYPMP